MKKIILIVATVMSAIFVHGASVSWTITNVNGPTGEALSSGRAYVFFVQQSSGKADTSTWVNLEGAGVDAFTKALADSVFNYNHADISASSGIWTYSATTARAIDQSTIGVSGSTKYSVYAVIFDTDSITKDSKYMITTASNAAATYADTAGTTKLFTIGNQATASGTWYNVPEPTSGLLLLLGMSCLALKRKQV